MFIIRATVVVLALSAACLSLAAKSAIDNDAPMRHPQFDVDLAKFHLDLCKISYCEDEAAIKNWTCNVCETINSHEVSFVRSYDSSFDDTRAIVGVMTPKNASQHRFFFVAFRGTSNIENWMTNAEFAQTKYENPSCDGCYVHLGFQQSEDKLGPDILEHLALMEHKLHVPFDTIPVLVTGHSLGAALATLFSIRVIHSNRTLHSFYNFGSPRVGNPAFARFAAHQLISLNNSGLLRVTHHRDPIPHLPFATNVLPPAQYQHVYHEVFFPDSYGLNYVNCSDTAFEEDPNCINAWYGFTVWDHLHYLDLLTNCNSLTSPEEEARMRKESPALRQLYAKHYSEMVVQRRV